MDQERLNGGGNMKQLLIAVVLLAACSNATGPQGLDPTVLITNQAVSDTLFFTWRDGQGIVGSATVLPGVQSCTKFTARADSAYFQANTMNNQYGVAATYLQPWFDPATRPAWTMQVTDPAGAPGILV